MRLKRDTKFKTELQIKCWSNFSCMHFWNGRGEHVCMYIYILIKPSSQMPWIFLLNDRYLLHTKLCDKHRAG